LAVAASMVLAIRFAYVNADTIVDALIRSLAAGVCALVGCYGPAWTYRALSVREGGVALLALVGFLICLSGTLAGGIGTIATGSDKSLATRANTAATYADWRKELERSRDRRAALPQSRPEGTIESDMTAARVDRRWTSSNACTDATVTASRAF